MRDQLSAYHDGELDAARREAVASHVGVCPVCRAYLARVSELGRVLRAGVAADVPAGLAGRVIRTASAGRRKRRVREWGIRITAAAAGLALCIGGQELLILRRDGSVAASAEATRVIESSLYELRGAVAGTSLRVDELDEWARRPEVLLVQEVAQGMRP